MGRFRAPIAVAALSAVAWTAVALDVGVRAPAPDVRRLVPGVDAERVTRLELRRGDQIFAVRRRGAGFEGEGGAAVDDAAVDSVLGAIEHTWVRRLRSGEGRSAELGLAEPRATTTVGLEGGAVRVLTLGVDLGERELVWVGTGRDAALITATEADQLFAPPWRLRQRRPFRGAAVEAFEVIAGDRGVTASGDPLEVEVAGGRARVDAAALDSVVESLRELELEPGGPAAAIDVPLVIRLSSEAGDEWIEVTAACAGAPGSVAVRSGAGDGCVDAAPLERARALAGEPLGLVEDQLIDPRRRPDSAVLRRGGDEVVIDPSGPGRDAALDWLAGLAGAASGPPWPLGPAGEPDAVVEIRYARGPGDRVEIRGGTARRNSEPVAFAITGADQLLAAEPVWFRARALIERDPIELVSARRGQTSLDTGAVAPLVAHLTAKRFVANGASAAHGLDRPRAVIELRFSPAPIDTGDPDAYRLEIGAAIGGGGCYARLSPGDGAVFVLAQPTCAALAP